MSAPDLEKEDLVQNDIPNLIDESGNEGEDDLRVTNVDQAVTWGTDWTTETIISQIDRNVIYLNPKFQRRDAWMRPRKSKFIESLILGLPIPQIILAERKDKKGTYLVLDGKQRLLALKQFCSGQTAAADQLRLQGLTVCSELNGLDFAEFAQKFNDKFNFFQSQSIRTVILKNWPDEAFLYTVFLRLNTGSVALSPQELRQALHPGPFMEFVDERSSSSKGLQSLLKLSKPDFRMRDVEIAVRFYAYKNFLSGYKGNLKTFLDDACKKLNSQWSNDSAKIKEQFETMESAIKVTQSIFTENCAFRKYTSHKYETRVNRAVFDIMAYYFSDPKIGEAALKKAKEIRMKFQSLCSTDQEFLGSLETSTKITAVVAKRMNTWGEALFKILRRPFHRPL